jgi:uncharacterized membrane protein HdeD (DUF308 family)
MVLATVVQGISGHHDDHMDGGWWWVMGIGWLVFLAALVIVAVGCCATIRRARVDAVPLMTSSTSASLVVK